MKRNLPLILTGFAFGATLLALPHSGRLFAWAFPGSLPPVYNRGSFAALAVSQMALVSIALFGATIFAGAAAVFITRPGGEAAAPLLSLIAKTGQSFPPAAVLAVLVPMVGFGAAPTVLALFVYSLLPITENAVAGLRGVPATITEAAAGMGMPPWRVLLSVELPLALPQALAGLRTAAVVCLGTATIGSTVGALTLGTPIIDGLVTNKPGFVLQGAVPLALLAVLLELSFDRLERAAKV